MSSPAKKERERAPKRRQRSTSHVDDVVLSLLIGATNVFLLFGVFVATPTLVLYAACYHPFIAAPSALLYALLSFDGSERGKGRPWPAFSERFWLFTGARHFFRMSVRVPESLGPNEMTDKSQYVFGLHPHGVCADYRLPFDGMIAEHLHKLRSWRVLVASVLFKFPVVRELCLWTHCVDGSRPTAEHCLAQGHSLFVVPGGEIEQLMTEHGKEVVYLRRRSGFVRLALARGCPVVPVYVFGANDLYRTSRIFYGARSWLVRRARVCVPIFWGMLGLPVPYRVPLTIVFGDPIVLDGGGGNGGNGGRTGGSGTGSGGWGAVGPPPEAVVAAHEKYVEALVQLFDRHKAEFGYGDRALKVV
ncbi:unnamed protein product [Phaeothamnion confervicola]